MPSRCDGARRTTSGYATISYGRRRSTWVLRQATPLQGTADEWWRTGESLHRFLAEHGAEWWVAEEPGAPAIVGYARSIERSGLFELTELFVRPGVQSRGIGRALLQRAFPIGRGEIRTIVATGDVRALARYYAADTVARFPMFTIAGAPSGGELPGDLTVESLAAGVPLIGAVEDVEAAVIGYSRSAAEIDWLLGDREGHVYRRDATVVGYAFVGRHGAGPIAAREPDDLPAILAHVEGRAVALGVEELEFEVPSLNEVAMRYLLERGYRLDPWVNYVMANRPYGLFDRFIAFNPPLFL